MAYWERIEGSLVLDIDTDQLDGYFIDRLGNQNDHFRISKGIAQVPTFSDRMRLFLVAIVVLLAGLGLIRLGKYEYGA